MKHLKTYKIFENLPPLPTPSEKERNMDEVAQSVKDILLDISDLGYQALVGTTLSEITVSIKSTSGRRIDLDEISDTIVHLYDYMKYHQKTLRGNPEWAQVSLPDLSTNYIGWGQLDKRNKDAYNSLNNGITCGTNHFYGIKIKWSSRT